MLIFKRVVHHLCLLFHYDYGKEKDFQSSRSEGKIIIIIMGRWFILISPGNNFSKTGLPLSNSNSMGAENNLGRSLLVYHILKYL